MRAAEARRLADQDPVVYLIFDLLHLDGRSLLELPYADRRQLLDRLELDGAHWRTPPIMPGGGAAALRMSRQGGQEGIVAKRRSSRYLPGRRSPDWVKIKNIRTQEVVVGGWSTTAAADERGRFVVDGLPSGSLQLRVSSPSIRTAWLRI